jgi:tetratricopeptide (TPR) repeat protein
MSRTPDQHWHRAQAYLQQGLLAPAQAELDILQARAPTDVRTPLLAADIAWAGDRVRDAAAFALAAAQRRDDDPELACDVTAALLRVGEVAAARARLAATPWGDDLTVGCLARLADFELGFGCYPQALAWLDRALATGQETATIQFYRGRPLTFEGRFDAAEAAYVASLRLDPTRGETALALVALGAQADRLGLLAAGLERVARGTRDHAAFEFARYRVLEDLGRYDEAWRALASANASMHARTPAYAERQLDALRRVCRHFAAHALPPAATVGGDGPTPIFIIGLPRSGTTVLERLLGNHPQVTAAGELFDFGRQLQRAADHRDLQDGAFFARLPTLDLAEAGRRYLAETRWRADGAPYFTDKQTSNWMLAGLIHAALPGAHILHLVRDPMDVCFSLFRAQFGDAYAIGNDLATLAAHHRLYQSLMARWKALAPGAILDVSYDALVRAPEPTMRAVLAHCGLAWEPACADLAANRTSVSTLSAAQIRQPLHARGSGVWRHYADALAPLAKALSAA